MFISAFRQLGRNVLRRPYSNLSMFDPPYLESMKPKIPLYDQINIQIKGNDYALIENYQKLVFKIASSMDLEVSDGWAAPPIKNKIQKFKPNGTLVDQEYVLNTYERTIQLVDLPNSTLPILVEVLQAALPQGVELCVRPHEENDDVRRYIPDLELKELKSQLQSLGGPVKKK